MLLGLFSTKENRPWKKTHAAKTRKALSFARLGNKGKLVGAKPPFAAKPRLVDQDQAADRGPRKRDLPLFNLAIDSKLRGCDVVAVRVDDVARVATRSIGAMIRQKKTRQGRCGLELTDPDAAGDRRVPTIDRQGRPAQLSRQFGQRADYPTVMLALCRNGWAAIGLDPAKFGHALATAHQGSADLPTKQGTSERCNFYFGHSKIESTVRYLGIEVDDAIEIAEKIDI